MRGLFHIQGSLMKVYIAGPMSGLPNFNRDRFNEIAALVISAFNFRTINGVRVFITISIISEVI
ncbi:DUF4406 domain-containing protein [Salmonella enterica]|uniref:DUF4406 domain-containing protein n=1 Tax=Salmonella enterica TaxID=28901 RepID=A0A5U3IW99_SALER|nr:DUF4406 domain-containing protein [Salmonella enterica]